MRALPHGVLADIRARFKSSLSWRRIQRVKILVRHEGWYRVTQPDLVKAGLDPNVDPALLHLYAEAVEQPMQITGATAGPGGFGPQAAINFYGTGIDTVFSGTRVYWLATCEVAGRANSAPAGHYGIEPAATEFSCNGRSAATHDLLRRRF